MSSRTKARTKAEARRAKHRSSDPVLRGIPARHPSGQRRRASVQEQRVMTAREKWQAKLPTLMARCRIHGLPITAANVRAMDDAALGYQAGELWRAKLISEPEHEAAKRFAELCYVYRKTIDAPGMTLPAYGAITSEPQDNADAIRHYLAADAALRSRSRFAVAQVFALLEDQARTNTPSLAALSSGLRRLAAHFGLWVEL